MLVGFVRCYAWRSRHYSDGSLVGRAVYRFVLVLVIIKPLSVRLVVYFLYYLPSLRTVAELTVLLSKF